MAGRAIGARFPADGAMRDLVHQSAKRTAFQVNHRPVITAFEINIVLVEQLPVDDRPNAVSLAQRRNGADFAVHEQTMEFLFCGEADRMRE